MRISGISNSNGGAMSPDCKEVEDYNALLQLLMEGDRIYIQDKAPIIVEKGQERFSILNIKDGEETVFDVSKGKKTGEFGRFLTNARRAIAHPELLF